MDIGPTSSSLDEDEELSLELSSSLLLSDDSSASTRHKYTKILTGKMSHCEESISLPPSHKNIVLYDL